MEDGGRGRGCRPAKLFFQDPLSLKCSSDNHRTTWNRGKETKQNRKRMDRSDVVFEWTLVVSKEGIREKPAIINF